MIDATTLVLSVLAFLLSLSITPLVRDLFLRLDLLDRPDGVRKQHARAVPRVGGIPIVISYVTSYSVLLAWSSAPAANGRDPLAVGLPLIVRLIPAAGIVFFTGLLDDLFTLRPWQKLAGQIAGACWAVWAGVRFGSIGGISLESSAALLLSVTWLIACTNAFNLIDGLDGLASGMGLFSTLTILVAAVLQRDATLVLATLPLCGSLLGFLRYNFNPASVFLGDSGSLLVGFLLGCYGVIWSQKSATILGMTAPLMALAIPLLDVALSIVRRWLRGQPIFSADRNHIHHRLLDKGLTHRGVVLVLYAACGLYAALSLLQSVVHSGGNGLVLIVFCAVTWVGIQHLGYFEFGLAGRFLFGGKARSALNGEIVLHLLETDLKHARTETECFDHAASRANHLGFHVIQASLNGRSFANAPPGLPSERWEVRISLPNDDYIHLARAAADSKQPISVGPLVELLVQTMPAKLDAIRRATSPGGSNGEPPPPVVSLLNLSREVSGYEAATAPQGVEAVSR